ncbi:MAG: HAMP domain-containing histidine kinase [Piscinibacter sp.]|nr:HAMP domain-containing histidine kinase [Piscinibacter sp.]
MKGSIALRLTLALSALLLAYGAIVAAIGRHLEVEHEQEAMQRLSYGLARHIVEHWPEVRLPAADADAQARAALLAMLMAVNPGIEVYLLDADGRVASYIGEPGMVRREHVDLDAVRRFLAGAALPLRGTDPKTPHGDKIFSAAMFPSRPGAARPPGYLYVVLEGQARERVAAPLGLQRTWQTASAVAALALAATLLVGALAVRHLTRPLRRLAQRMQAFGILGSGRDAEAPLPPAAADEVETIAIAFDAMALRIRRQLAEQAERDRAHREVMAGVAHDLRTPLTALHGHLEALAQPDAASARHAQAALAQSDKVRRLTQQLFELATLQTTGQVLQRERFRLDELVVDIVQKFEPGAAVSIAGPDPGQVECDGDLQLIERALTNLIDNSLRHAMSPEPVRVQLLRLGREAQVMVEDRGPGLPAELARRLAVGAPVREPPIGRPGGGIGGLGLAIVQRIAALHGGALRALPAPHGGTRLALLLPLAEARGAAP